ncbi:hypothetical protein D3C81_916100 [compost metagenome]
MFKRFVVFIKTIFGKGPKIKGNINIFGQKIYHIPGGQLYDKTNAEELFYTEEEAKLAGYRKSKR